MSGASKIFLINPKTHVDLESRNFFKVTNKQNLRLWLLKYKKAFHKLLENLTTKWEPHQEAQSHNHLEPDQQLHLIKVDPDKKIHFLKLRKQLLRKAVRKLFIRYWIKNQQYKRPENPQDWRIVRCAYLNGFFV